MVTNALTNANKNKKKMMTFDNIPGDPKKSIPLFGVSGETQVFAKQLNRHIFG